MLSRMRANAKYIWYFAAAAFVAIFLFGQTSGLLGRGPNTSSSIVATVNGRDIPLTVWLEAIRRQEQQTSQRLGRQLTLDEEEQLKQEVFDQLVQEILLEQEYARRQVHVSDDEVIEAARSSPPPEFLQAPELQTDGHFDEQKYQRFLTSPMARTQGVLAGLEALYRSEIPREKLFGQVASDVYVTDDQLWNVWRDTHDSSQISWVAYHPDAVPDSAIKISDAEMRQYYDTHHAELTRKGTGVLSLLRIPRTVTAADSAIVRKHLLDLRDEITHGASFADVAKRESADSTSAANGGSLGWGKRGRFVPEFERALWSLKAGQMSGPVLTPYGYHLIRVDDQKGDSALVSHLLLRIQQSDSSAARTNARADSLEKLASQSEDPAAFNRAATALGLPITQVRATEGAPVFWNGRQVPSVGVWAFNGGAHVGSTSDLVDAQDAYYLARIDSLTPGGLPTFEAAKPAIRSMLGAQKALDLLLPRAQALSQEAARTSLQHAADAQHLRVTQSPTFTPTSYVPDVGQLNQVVGAAFGLPVGAVSSPIRISDAIYVIRIDRRVPADHAAWEKQKSDQRQTLLRTLRQQRVRSYLEDLRQSARITDNRAAIEAANKRAAAT